MQLKFILIIFFIFSNLEAKLLIKKDNNISLEKNITKEISGLYISFGVKVGSMYEYYKRHNTHVEEKSINILKKSPAIDDGKLRLSYLSKYDILLKIDNYVYKYDKKMLFSYINPDFEIIFQWDKSNQIFKEGKEYKVNVKKQDIVVDYSYNNRIIQLTSDDIKRINNEEYVKKPIGSNYFIGFSKVLYIPLNKIKFK